MAIKLQSAGYTVSAATVPDSRENENQEVLTQGEAARFLKISVDTLRRATEEKIIPSRRLGGRILYGRQALLKWLNCEN